MNLQIAIHIVEPTGDQAKHRPPAPLRQPRQQIVEPGLHPAERVGGGRDEQ
jgi:hypothetical protein